MAFSTPHPAIDLNSVFNDEGESVLGWATTASTIASSGGWTTVTKTSGSVTAGAVKSVHVPQKDLLLYGKTKANRVQNDCQCVRLYNSAGKGIEVWWNNDLPAGTKVLDTVAIGGYKGATWNRAVCMTNWNSENEMEWLLWYDSKWGTVSFWVLESGLWVFKARVECDPPSGELRVQLGGASAADAWISFDYLSVCRPNFLDITDSAGGWPGCDDNPTANLTDFSYRWSSYVNVAPGLRNSFVVFKSVPGHNSTELLARLYADVLQQYPRCVFMHCGNDYGESVSLATRKSNFEAMVAAINGTGAHAVVLNANYCVEDDAAQPAKINYFSSSWDNDLSQLTGTLANINTMEALEVGGGDHYLDPVYAVNPPTDCHLTPPGQDAFAQKVIE